MALGNAIELFNARGPSRWIDPRASMRFEATEKSSVHPRSSRCRGNRKNFD